MKTSELLAPAGSLEKLKIAMAYGADAVYFGGKEFSLRARAGNLDREEIEQAVTLTRSQGVRSYVTLNVFARNRDLRNIRDFLGFLGDVRPDGIIVSDPGVIHLAREIGLEIPLHLSTQANTLNLQGVIFWKEQGIKRINLARELSFDEICTIREKVPNIELEVFIHGALCIAYSGRCMLSLYLTGREANQGHCAHPCRYKYTLMEEKRPGEFFPVEEDDSGLYIFNSRDLCLVDRLKDLVNLGIDALKIEGRVKGKLYLATVVRAYRAALDHATGRYPADLDSKKIWHELNSISSRGYTENFFHGPPVRKDMLYSGSDPPQTYIPVALVVDAQDKKTIFRACYPIKPGDVLEYMAPGLKDMAFKVLSITLEPDGTPLDKTLGGELISMEIEPRLEFSPYTLIRKTNPRA